MIDMASSLCYRRCIFSCHLSPPPKQQELVQKNYDVTKNVRLFGRGRCFSHVERSRSARATPRHLGGKTSTILVDVTEEEENDRGAEQCQP